MGYIKGTKVGRELRLVGNSLYLHFNTDLKEYLALTNGDGVIIECGEHDGRPSITVTRLDGNATEDEPDT